jgi:nitrite reductase (NADH) large subunit
MLNILIIGNSLSAVSAIEEIRRQDASSKITLFCPEGVLPYDRCLLPSFAARDIKESNLLAKPAKFFEERQVQVVLNEPLTRISTKRKQITTGSKAHISFDKLLLTDLAAVKLPSIKGHHKQGVFDIARLTAVKELVKYLPYADNIIVEVNTFAGFDMACALKRLGKEVIMVSATEGLLGDVLDDESSVLLKQIIEAQGIRVVVKTVIEEILGDAEVKAIRLKSGKVMAGEAVIFDNVTADLKILADTGLLEEDQFNVGEFFNTVLPEVFACDGALGSYDLSSQESMEQGRAAAANLLNVGSVTYEPSLVMRTFGSKICDGFLGGITRLQEGGREHMKFDGPQNIYKKIFLLDDCLAGVISFNAMPDKGKMEQALTEKMCLASREEEFLQ